MDTASVRVGGTAPLLMHNVRLANPLDEYVKLMKLITGKPKKTDADYEELFRLEHAGGLYYTDKIGPYIPGRMIRATMINGARLLKLGTALERTLLVKETYAKLLYDGPRDREKLYDSSYLDIRPVSAQGTRGGSKTMRCRPMFEQWGTEFTLSVDPSIISLDDLRQCVERAGAYHGFGDGRSEGNGRFEIMEWSA